MLNMEARRLKLNMKTDSWGHWRTKTQAQKLREEKIRRQRGNKTHKKYQTQNKLGF